MAIDAATDCENSASVQSACCYWLALEWVEKVLVQSSIALLLDERRRRSAIVQSSRSHFRELQFCPIRQWRRPIGEWTLQLQVLPQSDVTMTLRYDHQLAEVIRKCRRLVRFLLFCCLHSTQELISSLVYQRTVK